MIYTPHKTWLDNEYRMWIQALQESTVHNFKDHPMVKRMLGDVDSGLFADKVGVVPPIIATIDSMGRANITTEYVSGTCLRMLYYAQKVMEMNPAYIQEIGGGVGKFYAILRALGYTGEYFIHDLLEVKEFQAKYLAEVEKQTGLELPLRFFFPGPSTLCLSFYALGEFDDRTKRWYAKNIVNKCGHGLILWNPHSGASKEIPFECTVEDEYPMTHPDCKALTW